MKKSFFLFSFILITSFCFSQDYISLKNGEKKAVIISEISPEFIRYKDADNPDGTLYTIRKSDVVEIIFQNVKVERFDTAVPDKLMVINNKIYQEGKKLSEKDLKNLLGNTNAYSLYKQSKTENLLGKTNAILGALVLGWGAGNISSESIQPASTSIICIIGGAAIAGTGLYSGTYTTNLRVTGVYPSSTDEEYIIELYPSKGGATTGKLKLRGHTIPFTARKFEISRYPDYNFFELTFTNYNGTGNNAAIIFEITTSTSFQYFSFEADMDNETVGNIVSPLIGEYFSLLNN